MSASASAAPGMTPATDPRPRPAPGRAEGPTFAFHHVWRIAAPTPRVFEVLAAADRYAEWWPQIRLATREGPDDGMARVRSVLRRLPPDEAPATPEARPTIVPVGRHRLDLATRSLRDPEGREIPLTAMEFDLLLALAEGVTV